MFGIHFSLSSPTVILPKNPTTRSEKKIVLATEAVRAALAKTSAPKAIPLATSAPASPPILLPWYKPTIEDALKEMESNHGLKAQAIVQSLDVIYTQVLLQMKVQENNYEHVKFLLDECKVPPNLQLCEESIRGRFESEKHAEIAKILFQVLSIKDQLHLLRKFILEEGEEGVRFLIELINPESYYRAPSFPNLIVESVIVKREKYASMLIPFCSLHQRQKLLILATQLGNVAMIRFFVTNEITPTADTVRTANDTTPPSENHSTALAQLALYHI